MCSASTCGSLAVELGTPLALNDCADIEQCTPSLRRLASRPIFPDDELGEEWPASDAVVDEQFSTALASLSAPDTIEISPESSPIGAAYPTSLSSSPGLSTLNPTASLAKATRIAQMALACSIDESPERPVSRQRFPAEQASDSCTCNVPPAIAYVAELPMEAVAANIQVQQRTLQAQRAKKRVQDVLLQAEKEDVRLKEEKLQLEVRAAVKTQLQDEFLAEQSQGKSPNSAAVEVLRRCALLREHTSNSKGSCTAKGLEKKPCSFGTLKAEMISPMRALEC
jgi:hypothetical protein